MAVYLRLGLLFCLANCVFGGDPSTTWESFAVYTPTATERGRNVTLVSSSYVVPSIPFVDDGTTPKWWVGLQSADGMGVLMKPQLTWKNNSWVINTEVLDYSVTPSPKFLSKSMEVEPGDIIEASVRGTNSGTYTLKIGPKNFPDRVSSQVYVAEVAETRAYVVMEHQPKNCSALPTSGKFTFHDVRVEVGAVPGTATWTAMQHLPACGAQSTIVGRDIMFSWKTKA